MTPKKIDMTCGLCNKNKRCGKQHATKCNHSFHLSCLQKQWQDTAIFSCPTCSENIGLVVTSDKQAYIVFESLDQYQCVYIVKDTYVKPTNSNLSKWERIGNRLTKRRPSVLLTPIIVS